MGFSPRQAPGLDMLYPENNASISDVGMQAARSGGTPNAATAAAANSAETLAAGTAPASAAAAITAPAATTAAGATGAAAAQAAAGSGGLFTGFFGMSVGLAAPLMALVGAVFFSLATIVVIMGAFVVPIPTRDSNWKGDGSDGTNADGTTIEVENQFLDVTKTPSITQIENGVNTEVTYTIRVTPKNDYTIMITDVTDTFNKSSEDGPELTSSITKGSFPVDPITEPFEITYSVMIGESLIDTRVTNSLIVSFQAIDRSGFTVERNGVVRTSASIQVGTPVEGCWPVTGTITQLQYGRSHNSSHKSFNSDAYDIGAAAGTAIYAPYSGNLCRQPYDGDGYGTYVNLTVPMNGVNLIFIFAHLQSHVIQPSDPDGCINVVASDLIGRVDDSGNSEGHHLHYELVNDYPTGGLELQDLVPKENGIPKLGQFVSDCHE